MKTGGQLVSCFFIALFTVLVAAPTVLAQPTKPKDGPLGMKFVPLPKGTFYLHTGPGSAKKTEIKEEFEIAIYTVTQQQWQAVMGKNPSWFSREGGGKDNVKDIKDEDLRHFPVEMMTWTDVQEFIKKLNAKEKGNGYVYKVPTEAEWEYACRGGPATEEEWSYHFYFEKPTNDLSSKQANFNGERPYGKGEKGPYLKRPTKVGSYMPNKLGLYDMHGNVWHWTDAPWDEGGGRMLRGGGWNDDGASCTASKRFRPAMGTPWYDDVGFRLARVLAR